MGLAPAVGEPSGSLHVQGWMVNFSGVSPGASGGPKQGKLGLHQCPPGAEAPRRASLEARAEGAKVEGPAPPAREQEW